MQYPPGYMPPGQPNYGPPAQAPAQPGYAPPQVPSQAAPAPGPHYQPPPPAINPGYPAPVAPPMPGGASQGQPNFGAYQPPAAPPAPMPPGYMPQGAPAYGPPPGQGFSQPGAPGAGFQQGGFRQSGRRFSGADMAGVAPSGSRNPFLPIGQHVLRVEKTNQSKRKGSFVVEVTIMWTNSAETQVGNKHSWIQGCGDLDIALPAIKAFVIATLGCDREDQVAAMGHDLEQLYTAITDDQTKTCAKYEPNPLKGSFVSCSVDPPRPTERNPNSKFQRHNFSPVPRQG